MAVSPKKDKLLEEAQKLAARGLFDKAAKAYEQVLALEPSAINQRQKMAEILVKAGRPDDARKEFETIGKHFSKNGFYLKAIAVYKQLQKLFPSDISLSLTLAELNEKHGLTANALSEYKLVYDYHEKAGNPAEAVKILDMMQTADPQNITIKIKLAEALFKLGKLEDAYALFVKTATLLQDRGDNAGVSKLNARIKQLFPNRGDFVLEVLSGQVASGNAASAVNGLQGFLRSNPADKRAWDLIIDAYKRLDQPQKVKLAYHHYNKMLPDEPAAMAGLMHCRVAESDVKGTLELLDLYESKLFSSGLLEDLEKLYRTLIDLEPVNTRILEGLIRVSKASGDESEVFALSSRLSSLTNVSSISPAEPDFLELEPGLSDSTDLFSTGDTDSPFPLETQSEPPGVFDLAGIDSNPPVASIPETPPEAVELSDLSPFNDEDIEIELDIDDDMPMELPTEQIVGDALNNDDWLDSVGDLFDTISTAPSGVKYGSEMDSSDAQSHFDLGQAFREMGLFDEAISEFRKASSDSSRRMACLIMQGACLRDRGDFDTAISMLNTLLKPGLSLDDSCAVKYELVLTYEAEGKTDEANLLLNEIDSANPGFRDVSSRINAANLENSIDFSDDDLKNF